VRREIENNTGLRAKETGAANSWPMIKFSSDSHVRKWWNWQTHHLEGVAPKGVGVQIPPSAPILEMSKHGALPSHSSSP
jgi:hypothetical protein